MRPDDCQSEFALYKRLVCRAHFKQQDERVVFHKAPLCTQTSQARDILCDLACLGALRRWVGFHERWMAFLRCQSAAAP